LLSSGFDFSAATVFSLYLERWRAPPLVVGPEGTDFSATARGVIETLWAEAEHRSGCAGITISEHLFEPY